MEKKNFSTVDEVAECLDTDCYKELENIEVNGMINRFEEDLNLGRGKDMFNYF